MDDSLKKKLLVKDGRTLCVFNAPKGSTSSGGSGWSSTAKKDADVVLTFVANKKDVDALAEKAIAASKQDESVVWFAYPKKTGSMKTDISRDEGWQTLNARGWHPVTLVAIDDTWAAIRFKHAPGLGEERAARTAARNAAKKIVATKTAAKKSAKKSPAKKSAKR